MTDAVAAALVPILQQTAKAAICIALVHPYLLLSALPWAAPDSLGAVRQVLGQCPGSWCCSSTSLQRCVADFGSLVRTLQTSAPMQPGALVTIGPLSHICFAGMGSCMMIWKNRSTDLSIFGENQSSVFQDRTTC